MPAIEKSLAASSAGSSLTLDGHCGNERRDHLAAGPGAKQPLCRPQLCSRQLPLPDKGSRATSGADAHRTGNPDRPARRQAHRTGAIAASPKHSRGGRRRDGECGDPKVRGFRA